MNYLRLFAVLGLLVPCCPGQPIQLLTFDPINVDGSANSASTRLRLKNSGKQSPASCTLSIGDFRSTNTGQPLGVVPTFYDRDTAGPPPADGRAAGPSVTVRAAPDEEFIVKLDFAHMTEAGESKAQLFCDGKEIGVLVALKQLGLPFKVAVNENPPEKPELAFVDGRSLDVQLKNDDPVTYPLAWQLCAKGKCVQGSGTIGANDVASISISPDPSWFSVYRSFFKDETADGRLTLRYQPKGGRAAESFPAKTVPIAVHLNYFSPGRRDFQTTVILLVVLALGSAFSVYFSVDLVNRMRKVALRQRLSNLIRHTGEIAPQLSKQLGIILRLEHSRITAELPQGALLITPEAASVLAQCGTEVDALEKRVNLSTQVADARAVLDKAIDAGSIAPSLADRAERDLSAAQDLLKKSVLAPAEEQKIQTWIADAVNIVEDLDAPDPALEQTLTARLKDLQAMFTPAMRQEPVFVKIHHDVPAPFALLEPGGDHGSQADRDTRSRKLTIVADLIQMHLHPADEMIQSLRRQDLRSLRQSELLLREAKDHVTVANLHAAMTANPPQLSIVKDRDVVRVNRASLFKVVFDNPRYNQAAVKARLNCIWDFGDSLEAKSWEVYHYFDKQGSYTVSVTFRDEDQTPIPLGGPATLTVKVSPAYDEGSSRSHIEFQRWLIGFLVAVLGLLAGAKDKITSLDTLDALFAVFLFGFAIDLAKNQLISKQS